MGRTLLLSGKKTSELQAHESRKPSFPIESVARGNVDLAHCNVLTIRDRLARAYIAAGNVDETIRECRTLTTLNPQTNERCLIHPLYHYRLGTQHERKGQKAEAVGAYSTCLKLWGEADKYHPEPREGRESLARLESGCERSCGVNSVCSEVYA